MDGRCAVVRIYCRPTLSRTVLSVRKIDRGRGARADRGSRRRGIGRGGIAAHSYPRPPCRGARCYVGAEERLGRGGVLLDRGGEPRCDSIGAAHSATCLWSAAGRCGRCGGREGEARCNGRLSVCGGPVASERGLQRPRVVWGVSVDGHPPGGGTMLGEEGGAWREADHGRERWQWVVAGGSVVLM